MVPPIGTEQGAGDTVRVIMEDRSYGRLRVGSAPRQDGRSKRRSYRRLVTRLRGGRATEAGAGDRAAAHRCGVAGPPDRGDGHANAPHPGSTRMGS
jgi:hypothetical protein